MKEEVAKHLNNDEEKKYWYEIYENFNKNSKEGVTELVRKWKDEIKNEFDRLKDKIEKILNMEAK